MGDGSMVATDDDDDGDDGDDGEDEEGSVDNQSSPLSHHDQSHQFPYQQQVSKQFQALATHL